MAQISVTDDAAERRAAARPAASHVTGPPPRHDGSALPALPAHDMIGLLQHLQRTAGNQAVNALLQRSADHAVPRDPPIAGALEVGTQVGTHVGDALMAHSLHTQAVQRQPKPVAGAPTTTAQADNAPLTVQTASRMVESAYRYLFDNQRSGLERLGKALQKKKPSTDLVATLAAAAVGTALAAVLGPVGPAAEALVLAEDEVGRALVKKSADLVIDKAVEKAKDGVKEYISESKKTDPIDNFIESQSLAINRAQEAAIQAFLRRLTATTLYPTVPPCYRGW